MPSDGEGKVQRHVMAKPMMSKARKGSERRSICGWKAQPTEPSRSLASGGLLPWGVRDFLLTLGRRAGQSKVTPFQTQQLADFLYRILVAPNISCLNQSGTADREVCRNREFKRVSGGLPTLRARFTCGGSQGDCSDRPNNSLLSSLRRGSYFSFRCRTIV